MWKGFLHTSRYSYFDIWMLSIATTAFADEKIGMWISVTIIWLVSIIAVDLYYKDK